MKLLRVLFSEEVIETELFYWNLYGEDQDMPNFWWKATNLQVEWHNDDPGRGTFSNYEYFTPEDAVSLLEQVREDYDLYRDGK